MKLLTIPLTRDAVKVKADPEWWNSLTDHERDSLLGWFWEPDGWTIHNADLPEWIAGVKRHHEMIKTRKPKPRPTTPNPVPDNVTPKVVEQVQGLEEAAPVFDLEGYRLVWSFMSRSSLHVRVEAGGSAVAHWYPNSGQVYLGERQGDNPHKRKHKTPLELLDTVKNGGEKSLS